MPSLPDHEIAKLVETWIERHGRTARVEEILNRQALLFLEKDPKKSWERLRDRINPSFHHEADVEGTVGDIAAGGDIDVLVNSAAVDPKADAGSATLAETGPEVRLVLLDGTQRPPAPQRRADRWSTGSRNSES